MLNASVERIGSFHKWNLLARGMIALHPHLSLKVDKEIQYVDIDDEFAPLVGKDMKRMVDNATEVVRDTGAVTDRTVSRSEYGVENMAVSNTEPKYVKAALNPEHTWDDEGELIHIQSCPPKNQGGPQVYCPTCGQKFISTSNNGKVFFKHYSHFGSYRKHEWIWPADAEDTWRNARKTGWLNRKWGFERIHRNLGFDDAPNSSQILKAKSTYKKKQSRYQIPVFIENSGGNNWNFWVISKPNEKMKAGFNIENALEKIPGANGEHWFRIGDISKPTTIKYEGGKEEEVKWPIPIDSYSPVILSMNSGTLNHERFRYGDAESGHYYRRSSNGKCDALIGGVKFIKYKRADFVQFEIALPTINGSIPWLNTGQIIPINVKNALSDVTHLNPLQNIDAFGIRGDVHLNVDEFVQSYSTRKPAIEMKQTEDKGSSAKSLITLYPAHYIPVPEPAYISVDGIKSPIHTACFVEQVPEKISLSSESGKNYDLFERKCSVTYSVKGDETDLKWLQKEGQVKEILDFLRNLETESFSISITPNSRKMYDWIQITKLLPPTAELESEPKIEDDIIEEESPLEVEVDPPKIAGIQEREKDKFDRDSPKNLPPSNPVGVCRKCNSPTCRRSGMQSCNRRAKRWIKKWGGES